MSEKEVQKEDFVEEVEDVSLGDDNVTSDETNTVKEKEIEQEQEHEKEQEEKEEAEAKAAEDDESAPPLPTRKPAEKLPEPSPETNPLFKQLKEAFPNVDDVYINALLIASQGDLDKSFEAMLYVSDPTGSGVSIPDKPMNKVSSHGDSRTGFTQYEQDELLARQLNEKFNSSKSSRKYERDKKSRRDQRRRDYQRRQNTQLTDAERREFYDEGDDSWSQFVDKDLPEIRDMANKQIQETANKLNNWFGGLKKNFSNELGDSNYQNEYYGDNSTYNQSRNLATNQPTQLRERFNSFGARVGDDSLERHGITLRVDEDYEDVPPQLPTRTTTKDSTETRGNVTPEPKKSVIAQTTYIDTPENKKYKNINPEPMDSTPTKIKMNVNPDDDDFLINSDDEI